MAFITISGAPLADPAPVLAKNLERMLTESTAFLEAKIKAGVPIGVTEAGRGSITREVRSGGAGGGLPIAMVGSPLKHVAVINDGRRPGQRAPRVMEEDGTEGPLVLWVRRKVRIERVHAAGKKKGAAKTRKGVVLTRAPNESEARGIAFVIARSIGARGIEGRRFFENAIEEGSGTLERIFAEAGYRITIDLARGRG